MSVLRGKKPNRTKPNRNTTISASALLILKVSFLLFFFIYQKYSVFSHYLSLQEKNNIGFPTSGLYSKEHRSNTTLSLLSDLLISDLLIYYSFKISIFLYLKAASR